MRLFKNFTTEEKILGSLLFILLAIMVSAITFLVIENPIIISKYNR